MRTICVNCDQPTVDMNHVKFNRGVETEFMCEPSEKTKKIHELQARIDKLEKDLAAHRSGAVSKEIEEFAARDFAGVHEKLAAITKERDQLRSGEFHEQLEALANWVKEQAEDLKEAKAALRRILLGSKGFCMVTTNECGTDTLMDGKTCECPSCIAWLALRSLEDAK